METVKKILEQAGYYEQRKIDVRRIMAMYDNMGYFYNEKQKRFMEQYAFLEIHYTHPIWSEDMVINLNPMKAQDEISMDVVEEYNNFLEDQLLIIGEIEKENMTLFLSEKGFFYSAYDDCIINWGDDFMILLKKLVYGEKGILQILDN